MYIIKMDDKFYNGLKCGSAFLKQMSTPHRCYAYEFSTLQEAEEEFYYLKTALKELYSGNNLQEYEIAEIEVNLFRAFVDGKASDKNKTSEEILDDNSIILTIEV